MNKKHLYIFICALALAVSVIVPLCAILSYFPLWKERGEGAVISGFVLLLCVVAFSPLIKAVKRFLASPSQCTVWIISFVCFFVLAKISNEMTVISFVGAISNIIGAVLFKIGKRGLREISREKQKTRENDEWSITN